MDGCIFEVVAESIWQAGKSMEGIGFGDICRPGRIYHWRMRPLPVWSTPEASPPT